MLNRLPCSACRKSQTAWKIQRLLVDYASAIDERRFDDLTGVFTPDAYIDYRAMGGIDGHYPKVKAWLAEVLPISAPTITWSATSTSGCPETPPVGAPMCFNPIQLGADGQGPFCALWYVDNSPAPRRAGGSPAGSRPKCLDKLV